MEKEKYYRRDYFMVDKGLTDFIPKIFGYSKCEPNYNFGPVMREFHLLHYVVSGKGTLYVRGKKYKVKEKQAFFIRANEIARYTADKQEPWHYIWVGFLGKKAHDFDTLKSPIIDVETELFLQMMHIEYISNTTEEFIAGKLFLYLSLIFNTEKKTDHVSNAMSYIDFYYADSKCTVLNVADKIGLEKHYLARIFKRQTGKSIKEYITEKRMKNAVILLKNGNSVKEVSHISGYSDQFAFSKAFKIFYGLSPLQYLNFQKNKSDEE